LILGTELGNLNAAETLINANQVTYETMPTKVEPTSNSRTHVHLTKHLVHVTENPPQEYDENLESSRL
jgi:hypothetical protein